MDAILVSLAVGLLANALWYIAETVIESARTRENPPHDDQDD